MRNPMNCYSVVLRRNGRSYHRKGIRCDGLEGGELLLNGLGRFSLYAKPQVIEDGWGDEEIAAVFAPYEEKYPWVGIESDGGAYLYSMHVDRDNYDLTHYDREGRHFDYVWLDAPGETNLRYLGGNGYPLYRIFADGRQYALYALDGGGMFRYTDRQMDIMLEYLGDGEFIRR